ncbi:MAG: hypothetical protein LC540_20440 [Candidatus Thiodiazotropha sp.]|nr:hypothetical protein [Candidatus Thiodiazotropha sp.]
MEHFNGKNLLSEQRWRAMESLHLQTDAAGSHGFGAIFRKHWFNGLLPQIIAALPITFKKLFPIVLSLEIWGPSLRNQCLIAHSDNAAVVYIVNKQTCKDTSIMVLVRRLVLACMKYSILLRASHIPGKHNTLSDILSRLQVEEFHRLAPEMDQQPTHVPSGLLEVMF